MTAARVALQSLRDQRRGVVIWGSSLGLMSALMVAIYPSLETSLQKAVESYPDAIKETFKVEEIDSAAAYLDVEMFSLIVPLAAGAFAARGVAHAVAAAEERTHLDVLLAAPLARIELLVGVLVATALSLAGVLGLTAALALAGSAVSGAGLTLGEAAGGAVSVWPLGLFCSGLAALATGVMHRSAPVTAVAVGTLVFMYVIDLVGKIADGLDWVRWASVFRGYGSALRDGLDPVAFAVVALIGLLLAVSGTQLFERRDIYA